MTKKIKQQSIVTRSKKQISILVSDILLLVILTLITVVELKLFRRLPDGQVTLKSVLPPIILTCPSLQMLWHRSNTTQAIEKYVTYKKYIRLYFIDFIDRNLS